MPKYTKKQWLDRVVQYPFRFTKSGETATEVTLQASPGTITQAGTPISATNMNNLEDAADNANNEKASTVAALKRSLQNFLASQTGLAFPTFYGRTMANLLGKDGGCESLTPFTVSGTVALSTAQNKSGSNSIKLTTSSSGAYFFKDYTYPLDTSKQYILAAWVYIESWTSGNIALELRDVGTLLTSRYSVFANTSTIGSWQFVYVKIPTANTLVGTGFRLLFNINTGTSVTYVDSIRLYELSSTDYSAIGTTYTATTTPSIDDFIPYVDGIQHVVTPALTKVGRNRLPPFTEWTLHANAVVTEPYKLMLNATAQFQSTEVHLDIVASQTYTMNVGSISAGGYFAVRELDASGNVVANYDQKTSAYTLTTGANTKKLRISVGNNVATGTFTFSNPMLIIGTTADLPPSFEPRNDDYVYGVSNSDGRPLMLASNIDGSVRDSLTIRDGVGVKFKRFDFIDLTADLPWTFHADNPGYKNVELVGYPSNRIRTIPPIAARYDGKIYQYGPITAADMIGGGAWEGSASPDNGLRISIADTDSGWTDTLNPNTNAIKALMNGWKANGNNGTVYNSWVSIIGGSAPPTNTEAYVAANKAPGWVAWGKLTYQISKPVEEIVTVEGAITLQQGGNALEMAEGVIVREKANPYFVSASNVYNINNYNPSSRLTYRVNKILQVLKNGKPDKAWTIVSFGSTDATYGNQLASIPAALYDPTAEYTVTYLALDKYGITANVVDATLEHWPNVGSAVAVNARTIADMFPILGGFRSMLTAITSAITAITGKTKWTDAPTKTMEQLNNEKANLSGATFSGKVQASPSKGLISQDGSAPGHGFEVAGNGPGNAAFAMFHRPNEFAAYFGVDADNKWKVGGYSMGTVAYEIWHEGNFRTTNGYPEIKIGGVWQPVGGARIGASNTVQDDLPTTRSVNSQVMLVAKIVPKGVGDLLITGEYSLTGATNAILGIIQKSNYVSGSGDSLYPFVDNFNTSGDIDWRTPIGTNLGFQSTFGQNYVKLFVTSGDLGFTSFTEVIHTHTSEPLYIIITTFDGTMQIRNLQIKYDIIG